MLKRRALRKDFRKRTAKCTYCGGIGHSSFGCYQKPRNTMQLESTKSKEKRQALSQEWHKLNKPDATGHWYCYLCISPHCTPILDIQGLTLEHVYPKNKYPKLKYEVLNVKASCAACNKLKMSNTINRLSHWMPRIRELVGTPEWQMWEGQMAELADQLGILLDSPPPGQLGLAVAQTD